MTVSSRIKSILAGEQKASFRWLEEKTHKKNRRDLQTNRKYYTGFLLNDLKVSVGDGVFINMDGAWMVRPQECEIARVLECYDTDQPGILGFIKVQWYTLIDQVRPAHRKQIPSGLPAIDGDREVVSVKMSYDNEVDLETILSLCTIVDTPATVCPEDVRRPLGSLGRLFVCRFSYTNKRPWVTPFGTKDIFRLENQSLEHESRKTPIKNAKEESPKKKVKRKLLEPDEDQENVPKKTKKENRINESEILLEKSPRKSILKEKSNNENIGNDFNSENTKNLGQIRGLKSLEISDLLGDDSLNGSTSTKSSFKQSKKKSFQRRLKLDESDDEDCKASASPRKRDGTPKKNILTPKKNGSTPQKKLKLTLERLGEELNEVPTGRSKRNLTPTEKMRDSYLKLSRVNHSQSNTNEYNVAPKNLDGSLSDYSSPEKSFSNLDTPPKSSETPENTPEKTKSSETPKSTKTKPKTPKSTKSKTPKSTKSKTPKSTKSSKTPKSNKKKGLKIPERTVPLHKLQNEFERAREQLHVSAVPKCLPCREDEFHQIFSFVEAKLLDSTGGCMYISGVPGTGKTATVREVVRVLRECEEEGSVPSFTFLEMNAMKLTKPHQLWVQIWEGLTGQRATPDHAFSLLTKMLSASGPKRQSIFLLLDELDLLWTRKQDVMYNLFDLSSRTSSRLVVVTIANTMDLPERMMISRVSSRLGLTRMTFQPYTFKQLEEIIQSRLSGIEAFDPDAIQLVSRKVAAVSGDARRALDICRRATELSAASKIGTKAKKGLSPSKKGLVGMTEVSEAIQEMFSSPKITAIRRASEMERQVLQAIMMEFMRTGVEEALFVRVVEHLRSQCLMDGLTPPITSDVMKLVNGLSSQRLLLAEHSRQDLLLRIRLNISTDDVTYALSL